MGLRAPYALPGTDVAISVVPGDWDASLESAGHKRRRRKRYGLTYLLCASYEMTGTDAAYGARRQCDVAPGEQ
eukprot:1189773-Rhodomonas_salina.1